MHWKGGVLGSLVAILGWATGHVGALTDLAGQYANVVSAVITVGGILTTALSQKVGAPKAQ